MLRMIFSIIFLTTVVVVLFKTDNFYSWKFMGFLFLMLVLAKLFSEYL